MINQLHKTFITIETPVKFKVSQMMSKSIDKLAASIHRSLKQISILLIPVPLFMLIIGIEGIIKQESPDNLASFDSVSSGFFNFLDMHFLIIAGAFSLTFIIWFLTRNIWVNPEDECSADSNSGCIDEYQECADEELGVYTGSLNHKKSFMKNPAG